MNNGSIARKSDVLIGSLQRIDRAEVTVGLLMHELLMDRFAGRPVDRNGLIHSSLAFLDMGDQQIGYLGGSVTALPVFDDLGPERGAGDRFVDTGCAEE